MPVPVHVPRVNNNDDEVKLVALNVGAGQQINAGELIAQVETDKAIVDVEASAAGFVLGVLAEVDQIVPVGSVLMWIGATVDEPLPEAPAAREPAAAIKANGGGRPTARARARLAELGLEENDVPASGERLSVADIERFLATRSGTSTTTSEPHRAAVERKPEVEGTLRELRSDERGMLHTVTWHRDVAVPGYIEISYDPAPWEAHAQAFASTHKLLLSPLLALMTHRLVKLAQETPALNATIVGEKRYEYQAVNVAFTVQAGETLYLTVVREAQALTDLVFVNTLSELQRRAAVHKLGPAETSGTTISFSSMARWKVNRHIPILPPHTALMIAHTVAADGTAVLGATYDHRVLNGFHVAGALRKLSKP